MKQVKYSILHKEFSEFCDGNSSKEPGLWILHRLNRLGFTQVGFFSIKICGFVDIFHMDNLLKDELRTFSDNSWGMKNHCR